MSSTGERIKAVAEDILGAFHRGDVPKAMAQVFIRRRVDVPSRQWSWTNRLIGILRGHIYAAGFRQWRELGRSVKGGERAFYILGPRWVTVDSTADESTKTEDESAGEKKKRLAGFLALPVFGYLQTTGDSLPGLEDEPEFVSGLPLIEVARYWGLSVGTYSASDAPGILGQFLPGAGIGLGVENLSTWAHELIHAADTLLGNPRLSKLDAEVVAELGGAILLEVLGQETASDRGGCYEYICRYAESYRSNPLLVCHALLDRTCRCVSFLLEEADRIGGKRETQSLEGVVS